MKRLSIFCLCFMMPLLVRPQSGDFIYNAPFDVFLLNSVQHIVVAQGAGYFPVLNSIEDALFTVFRTGGGHLGQRGALTLSWSMDGGLNWDPPIVLADSRNDDRNPAACITSAGRMVVAYHEQASYNEQGRYDPSLNRARCLVTWSEDLGQTWTPAAPLGVPGLNGASPYGRIVESATGELLMNVYGPYTRRVPGMREVRTDARDYSYLVRSSDGGETWQSPSLIAADHNETALFLYGDGRMIAAARSVHTQQINLMHSTDYGYSWRPPLRMTNPMQHPADIVELSNGWLLMLYGDRSRDFKTIQGIISQDQGRSWNIHVPCVFSRPVNGDFGYPSGATLLDGHIVIQYYWAGRTADAYDGSQARLYMTRFDEQEFIDRYNVRLQLMQQ